MERRLAYIFLGNYLKMVRLNVSTVEYISHTLPNMCSSSAQSVSHRYKQASKYATKKQTSDVGR